METQNNNQQTLTALDIASYFVQLDDTRDIEDGITNLKLQKLLYYAQGYHLAYFDKPLFADPIKAWQYGPVVPNVYQILKQFGRYPVDFSRDDFQKVNPSLLANDSRNLLDSVFEQLGQYSAWKLMEMTHEEDPWKHTDTDEEISHQKLKAYFETKTA